MRGPRGGLQWIVALVLLGLSGAAEARADYRVRAYLQPDREVTEQESVRLIVEAEGQGSPQLAVSGLEDLNNLRVVGSPQRQFNSIWSNGRMNAKTSLSYTLIPLGPGPAEVPPLSVEVDGQRITTAALRFSVLRAQGGAPPHPAPRAPRGESDDQADVFLRAQLGVREAWVGQSVPLSVLLYTAERVSSPALASQPGLATFWVEDIDVDPNAEATRASIEGRRYDVFPILRKVLVPQSAGDVEIEPFVMQIPVTVRSGDPIESLFSLGRRRTVVRKTEPLTLHVRALPENGRPAGFGGAVGRFKLTAALDRREAATNDAVALTVTVEGEGFLRAVAPPELGAPPDLKVFPPKVSASARPARDTLVSRKSWEWILVPLVAGELRLPPVRFAYFDPDAGEYRVATEDTGPLVVRAGGQATDLSLARGEIQVQRRDLAFIKPLRGTLRQASVRVHGTAPYLALLLLPLVWAPLVIVLGRRRARLQQNLGLARSRRARRHARTRLQAARRRLSASGADFHQDVARALVEYVADRTNRSAAGLTYDLTDELLAERGVDETLRRRFRGCLESCDFARFVPSSAAPARRAELLDEAETLIDAIERAS